MPPEYAKTILIIISVATTIQIHLMATFARLWKRKLIGIQYITINNDKIIP